MRLVDRRAASVSAVSAIAPARRAGGRVTSAGPFYLPQRHPRHVSWSGSTGTPTTSGSSPARARARAPDRRAGEAGKLVGSDLSYEDIGGRDDRRLHYAMPTNATGPRPTARHPAWPRVAAQGHGAAFPRAVSLVLKDNFVVGARRIFNRRDEREKVFESGGWSAWTASGRALDLVVSNERDKTRTELIETSLRYNVGLSDDDSTAANWSGARDEPVVAELCSASGCAPLCAVIVLGFVCFAPQSQLHGNRQRPDAWVSETDPVYLAYERFRAEFGGQRNLIIALQSDAAVHTGVARVHPRR